jgi:hypothetical protein
MATLSEIKNNVQTIENISEEVFKYEMEISHLHENSEYYIIDTKQIYTKKGYNYILRNADGNFYWSNHYINDFMKTSKCPIYFHIKTHEYHKLIDQHGDIYLDEYKKPIIELEVECEKCDMAESYKYHSKEITKNKVVDDYYVSRYIYGLRFTTKVKNDDKKDKEQGFKEFENPKIVQSYDILNRIITIKEKLKMDLEATKDIKNKLDGYKDTISKLSEIKEILDK